ncbi:hypothetical protein [Pseudomonas mangrovi]|uniref:hypothetical protein n=1 Tax=Pseudomonas mangrovi TaxID=2161748 RepID=UPI0011B26981|nr:hypothetical protein [Pseudomonas mangrovi]
MRSSLSGAALVLLALVGCDQAATPPAATPSTSPAVVQTQSLDLGSYTKNQTVLELQHYLVLPSDDPLKLRVLFTPDALSDTERQQVLENRSFPGMALFQKASPEPARWQWYPYVLVEAHLDRPEVSTENVTSFYVMAYGIEEQNFTDNISAPSQPGNGFEQLEYRDGLLRMRFAGKADFSDSRAHWDIRVSE